MKAYIDKSALVAELNRLIAELVEEGEDTMFEQGRISAFEDIKVFINHILEVKEVEEEPVSNDLEEAATKYARKQLSNPDYPIYNDEYEMECAFEAGAQWQKEQMVEEACKWLELHDSYAVPTNIKVRDLKEHLSSK